MNKINISPRQLKPHLPSGHAKSQQEACQHQLQAKCAETNAAQKADEPLFIVLNQELKRSLAYLVQTEVM